ALAALQTNKSRFLEPVGKTDSELAFCLLLNWLFETRSTTVEDGMDQKARKLSDCSPELILGWFAKFDPLGEADMMITDGVSLVCFHGRGSGHGMYYTRTRPPSDALRFDSEVAALSFPDPRDTYRTALIVSTIPFAQGEWTQMQPGQMIIVRRGMLVWDSQPENQAARLLTPPPRPLQVPQFQTPTLSGHESILNVRAITKTQEGRPLSYRAYDLKHTTTYRYEEPVQHSTHVFRLHPVEDSFQEVLTAKFVANIDGEEIRYDDVFGNASLYYSINKPYSTLTIESQSRVKLYASPPDDHTLSRRQTQIPLVWMPWQRQMMMPYLLPQELPETQLDELTAYAMSFVERNDGNLMHVLKDINLSIYRDYEYVQGTTSLSTTPFDVYTTRRGVCQDFANLFICLARLLSIPARYR
ncbi:MAG: class II glutamine amidotransferase, partial [Alphaproteobacteria bacterium]